MFPHKRRDHRFTFQTQTSNEVRFEIAPEATRKVKTLTLFRIIGYFVLAHFLHSLLELSISLALLDLSVAIGSYLPILLLRNGRSFGFVLLSHFLAFFLLSVIFWLGDWLVIDFFSLGEANDFSLTRLADTVFLLFLAYFLSFFSSWLFWTRSSFLTLETLSGTLGFIWLLSSHRDYHIDAPKQMSDVAWWLHLSPEIFLLLLALCFSLLTFTYLFLATTRPLFSKETFLFAEGKNRPFLLLLLPLLFAAFLLHYAIFLRNNYSKDLGRASNGVGQEGKEGKSPLGFHSAVGQTKQPAALVRLEGDYERNPWEPMLYLREGALSEFNGNELVIARNVFDTDVPRLQPGENFSTPFPPEAISNRSPITQSIFLIAEHTAPFALDTPYDIQVLKNPDPNRFLLAYQAKSLAPTIPLAELMNYEIGDLHWSAETWEHYLRAPGSFSKPANIPLPSDLTQPAMDQRNEDLRYLALSQQLTENVVSLPEKAAAITRYLSESSIYTRQPGHTTGQNADPVAPYLFAEEKRGYCVHFAHAAVYLMRLAGIPSRIATGYLTDLGYAKDGHILLQLGDRHAWPEIFVRGVGWVVVDITPTQAENEQVAIPDEKLLEELMNSVDKAELLDLPSVEPTKPEDSRDLVPEAFRDPRTGKTLVASLLLLFLLAKLWLRFGYLLPVSVSKKTRAAYRAFSSAMSDLGYGRQFGETRAEYARRLNSSLGVNAIELTHAHEALVFGSRITSEQATTALEALTRFNSSLHQTRLRKWILPSYFSPLSLWNWQRR